MKIWDTSHLLDDAPANKKNGAEYVFDLADSHADITRIREHFKHLQTRLIVGLLVGFLLPNLLLSVYFHFQFTHSLKKSALLNLETVVESQKNTVDLYLQERIVNLFNVMHSKDFTPRPTQDEMDRYLFSLKRFNDGFVDVGLLDAGGRQISYAGPYPALLGVDYSGEAWYKDLIGGKKDYLITDIYLGLRKTPHFTIVVRQLFKEQSYVLKASLDPDKLYIFLRSISQDKEVESTLVNRDGIYQVVDPGHSSFPERSAYIPPAAISGQEEIARDGRQILLAYSWLNEAPWALLTSSPASVFQADVYRARLAMTTMLIAIILVISAIIYFRIKYLVDDARRMAEKGQQLQEMLAHASKLASIGELAAGVAHEINNPLGIIMAESGVIRDMLTPEFELDHSPEAILKELSVIDTAVARAKGITGKLREMGDNPDKSHAVRCDVNALLEEVTARLARAGLRSGRTEIVKKYGDTLPEVLTEPEPLRQVLTNIIINADEAIVDKGVITIATECRDDIMIVVTISDTGKGIPPENLPRIFNPFFTTKNDGSGTGLGLSIAASIIKYLGGTIQVNSIVGAGSAFTVLLPVDGRAMKRKK